MSASEEESTQVSKPKIGSYCYPDGTHYTGEWNDKGMKHGMGHVRFANGATYIGRLENGFPSGLGIIQFSDTAKYEGEFMQGWFHGHGVFWRNDGMRFEGEFRGGRVWGCGLVTYADGSHGFPRNEGLFQDCRFIKQQRCPETILKAQNCALLARQQCQNVNV